MKEKALQVLLVEDNAGDARLLREMFATERPESVEVIHVLRMSEALIHLAKGGVDVVLLDMGLPDEHGLDTVRRAHAAAPDVPLIVLTGLDDEALATEAMKEGAQDYLIKGQIENRALPRALRHAIERQHMQAEADLVWVHQVQFKDEFLSHVSHELRSPLTAIYLFVTILLDRLVGDISPKQHKYLESILTNVKQLQAMINDLFEVTRVQTGKLLIEAQRTSVYDAIVYAVNTLQGAAATKGITLSSDVNRQLPSVCADPTRVRQILIILVDNAIKFTPPDGAAQVRARVLESNPSLVILEVSDSGCGISPDMTDRIFERHFQASDPTLAGRKGLGLGLYICRELVMRQGGQIWAKSAPGRGAVFSVTLPIFSLRDLIAPALGREIAAGGPATLVVTEIGSQTGWLSDEVRAEHSQGVRDLLQRSLYSRLDVLLPKMGPAGATELFFIVAATNEVGGEAITRRIREQWDGVGCTQHAGLTLSTSHQSLGIVKQNAGESAEDCLTKVATTIQDLINCEISLRMVDNEQ